jgi:hypothetical protein
MLSMWLYNTGTAMTSVSSFSGLAIANGKVFAVDHDSNLYCSGLPPQKERDSAQLNEK